MNEGWSLTACSSVELKLLYLIHMDYSVFGCESPALRSYGSSTYCNSSTRVPSYAACTHLQHGTNQCALSDKTGCVTTLLLLRRMRNLENAHLVKRGLLLENAAGGAGIAKRRSSRGRAMTASPAQPARCANGAESHTWFYSYSTSIDRRAKLYAVHPRINVDQVRRGIENPNLNKHAMISSKIRTTLLGDYLFSRGMLWLKHANWKHRLREGFGEPRTPFMSRRGCQPLSAAPPGWVDAFSVQLITGWVLGPFDDRFTGVDMERAWKLVVKTDHLICGSEERKD
jgi:hypothetical protein